MMVPTGKSSVSVVAYAACLPSGIKITRYFLGIVAEQRRCQVIENTIVGLGGRVAAVRKQVVVSEFWAVHLQGREIHRISRPQLQSAAISSAVRGRSPSMIVSGVSSTTSGREAWAQSKKLLIDAGRARQWG